MNSPETLELLSGLTNGIVLSLQDATEKDVHITHAGPNQENKYAGWIMTKNGRPLINSSAKFDTPEAAEAHMRKVLEAINKFEFPKLET